VSVVTALLAPLAAPVWKPLVSFGLLLAFWVIASTVVSIRERVRNVRSGVLAQLARQPRSYWGMVLAHLGVAVFVVGVTLVKSYESDQDAKMKPGESVSLGAYAFRLDQVSDVKGPNYVAARARISVTRGGEPVTVLYPEKRLYTVQNMPMTEAAIRPGLTGDLYVSLGDPLDGGAWLVKVQHKPFVDWIWGGCVIMALGGLLAASDRRYRVTLPAKAREAAARVAA
jgi:cytochrome c-type biogenesis protein CcmF